MREKFLFPECCSALSQVKDTGRCWKSGSQPDVIALSPKQLEVLPIWSTGGIFFCCLIREASFTFWSQLQWSLGGWQPQCTGSLRLNSRVSEVLKSHQHPGDHSVGLQSLFWRKPFGKYRLEVFLSSPATCLSSTGKMQTANLG